MEEKTKAKKIRKQARALEFLKQHMDNLPDDPLGAVSAARKRLDMKASKILPSHPSIMAHFNVIFSRLGISLKTQPNNKRKPIRQALSANSNGFLKSYEWRKLRMVILKEHGARCQCCGKSRHDGVVIHVDHIKPRKKYPELALVKNNLQVLCDICNQGKGNWDETDWRKETEQEIGR